MPLNPKLIPNLSFIAAQPTDPDEVLRERARVALPRIIADLGRQAGEAAWKDMPASIEMPVSDKARLIRETADAFQRKLTSLEINDILDEVLTRLRDQRDAACRKAGR